MGGVDETFFAHMEEIDLCWRLNRAGHKVMYCGNSTVYHVGGATLHKSNPKKAYYNFRNGMIMLIKNLGKAQLAIALPIRLVLDWMAAIRFLFLGKGGEFVARAHLYVLAHLRGLASKRASGTPYMARHIYPRPILVDYHLRGKRKFTDLRFNSPR